MLVSSTSCFWEYIIVHLQANDLILFKKARRRAHYYSIGNKDSNSDLITISLLYNDLREELSLPLSLI
jgi:hypothetical protein